LSGTRPRFEAIETEFSATVLSPTLIASTMIQASNADQGEIRKVLRRNTPIEGLLAEKMIEIESERTKLK
jgi:hypothetical protein